MAEGHTEVVGLGDLKQGQHALGGLAGSDEFLSQGEDAGSAGREQNAEVRFATKPPGPCDAAMVKGGFEVVLCQGLSNQTRQTFHEGSVSEQVFSYLQRKGLLALSSQGFPRIELSN